MTQTTERLHALDAVRGFALLAGVAFHATASFLPGAQPMWIVMDVSRSQELSVLFFVLHMFRMTTFFLLAGFFARMSFHRRGPGGFIADRAKRIAIPLVAAWPILFVSITAVVIWAAIKSLHGAPPPKGPPPAFPTLPDFPLTHLWFLWVLLLLYVAALILRAPVALADRSGGFRRGLDRLTGLVAGNVASPVLMAVPVFLAFALQPKWMAWFGIWTPDQSLIPNAMAIVGYGAAFGFGWLIQRRTELLEGWARRWQLNLLIAAAVTAALLARLGIEPLITPVAEGPGKWLTAALFAIGMWSWTLGLTGAALAFLHREKPVRRYLADASYWLYLIHLPIVMALQTAFSEVPWPWIVKYPLILAIAVPLMLLSYQLMVRHSWLGALLNGRKVPKRGKAALEPTASLT